MKPAAFEYEQPTSLDDVTTLLQRYGGDAKLLARGAKPGPAVELPHVAAERLDRH